MKRLPNDSPTLSIQQAAAILGVSIETLRRWDSAGVLVADRTDGKQRRYSISQLQEFKKQRRKKPAATTASETPVVTSLPETPMPQVPEEIPQSETLSTAVNAHKELEEFRRYTYATHIPPSTPTLSTPSVSTTPADSKEPESFYTDHNISKDNTSQEDYAYQKPSQSFFTRARTRATNSSIHILSIFLGIIAILGLVAVLSEVRELRLALNPTEKNSQSVLAESDFIPNFIFKVNSVAQFAKDVIFDSSASVSGELFVDGPATFNSGLKTNNQNGDFGTGIVIASNIPETIIASVSAGTGIGVNFANPQNPTITNNGVTSFQGSTGSVTLTAGSGISISGTTISSTVTAPSASNSFANIAVSGEDTLTAGSSTETLTIVGGTGLILNTDNTTKTLTIDVDGASLSQWTTTGSDIYYSAGNVGIGTSTPGAALDVSGTARVTGLSIGGDTLSELVGTGLQLNGGSLEAVLGTTVALGAEVTGVLPVANGGTGATSLTDLIELTTMTTGNYVANVTVGNGLSVSGSAGEGWAPGISLDVTTSGETATISSSSGLEVAADGLSLIRGCADGEILKWDDTNDQWECSPDTGGGGGAGIETIQENNTNVVTSATVLDFTGSDFIITNPVAGKGNVAIDYANSNIVRSNQNETISGNWTFSNQITLGSDTVTDITGTGLTIAGGALQTTLGVSVDLGTEITGVLPLANGGTNKNLTAENGGIVYSDADSFEILGAGNAGQILQSGGAGAPTWVDASAVGTNYWQVNAATLAPITASNGLVLGDNTSTAHFLEVNGSKPGKALVSFNQTGDSDIFTASSSGTTRFTIGNSGTLTTSYGAGILQSDANGVISSSAVELASSDVSGILPVLNGGTGSNTLNDLIALTTMTTGNYVANITGNAQITVGNGSASEGWAPSLSIAGDSIGDSQLAFNTGQDLTTSSNVGFAQLSLTGLLDANGQVDLGDGGETITLAGTTIGLTSTGAGNDISFLSADDISFDDAQLTSAITLTDVATSFTSGHTGIVDAINAAYDAATGGEGSEWILSSGKLYPATISDQVGIGTTTGATIENSFYVTRNLASGALGKALAIFNQTENQDIFTASASGTTRFTIANSGTITTSYGTGILHTDANGVISSSAVNLANSDVTGTLGVGNGGTGVNGSSAANGTLLIGNGTGYSLATLSEGEGIDITNGAGSITITGEDASDTNKGIASFSNTTFTVTAGAVAITNDAIGDTQLAFNTGQHLTTSSNVGFAQLALTGLLDANGQVDLGDGGDAITLAGTTIGLTSTGAGNDISFLSADNISFDDAQLTSAITLTDSDTAFSSGDTGIVDAINAAYAAATGGPGGGGVWSLSSGKLYPTTISNQVGIGTTTGASIPSSFYVTRDLASGALGKALAIFNQSESQDLLSASASGTTRFTISNSGNIGFAGSTGFINTLTSVATAGRTYTLPDTTGTICIVEAGNCAGSGTGITGSGTATQLAFFSGGSQNLASDANLYWNNTSKLFGIGTTSPVSQLDVTRSLSLGATGKALAILNQIENQDIFTASAGGTTRFVIANNGNVGIGTNSPSRPFHVSSTAIVAGLIENTSAGANSSAIFDISQATAADSLAMVRFANDASGWSVGIDGSDSDKFKISRSLNSTFSNTKFTMETGGNIGIGTTTPTSILDIAGASGASTSGILTFRGTTNPAINFLNGENLNFQSSVGGDTGLTSRLFINGNSGYVGVGTTAPDAKFNVFSESTNGAPAFSVNGGATGSATDEYVAYLLGRSSTFPSTVLRLASNRGSSSSYNFIEAIQDEDGTPSTAFIVKGDGNVGIGTSTPGAALDVTGSMLLGAGSSIDTRAAGTLAIGGSTQTGLTLGRAGASTSIAGTTIGFTSNGAGNDISFLSADDISFDDVQLTSAVTLTDQDTSLPNSNTGIIDAINDAYNAAIGGTGSVWTLSSGKVYPTTISNQVGIGTTTGANIPSSFYVTRDLASGALGKALTIFNQTENADIFTASASGSTRFVINNAGNVGIGTNTPSVPLHVNGNITASSLRFQVDDASLDVISALNDDLVLEQERSDTGLDDIRFRGKNTNGTREYMRIVGSTGFLGVGTSTPNAELHVTRPISYGANGKALAIFDQTENQDILTASAGGTTRFVINNAGNVGIGTNAPASILDVNGVLTLRPTANVSTIQTNSTDARLTFVTNRTSSTSIAYQFQVDGGTQALTILDDGNVGLGLANPGRKLDVISDLGQSSGEHIAGYFGRAAPASNVGGLFLGYYSDGVADSGGMLRSSGNLPLFLGTTSSNQAITILNAGNVGIGTTAPGQELDVNGDILVGANSTIDTRAAGTLAIGGATQTGLTLGRAGASTSIAGTTIGFTSNGASNDISFLSADDISFDDAQLTSAITLTDVDTSFTSGETGIVDAINRAFDAASGSSGGLWTLSTGKVYPTTINNQIGVGTTTGSSIISSFFVTRDLASGALGKALAIFDQTENQDLITASASGTTAFTVTRAGLVNAADLTLGLNDASATISTQDTNEALTLDPNGTGAINFHSTSNTIDSNGNLTLAGDVILSTGNYIGLTGAGRFEFTDASPDEIDVQAANLDLNTNLLLNIGHANTDFTSGGGLNVAGNVGIGTTAPTTNLDIVGSASLSANLSFNGAGTAHTLDILDGGTLNIRRSPGGSTGQSTAMFISGNGNIGIGTTAPAQTLQVGNSSSSVLQVGAAGGAYIYHTTAGIAGGTIGFNGYYDGSNYVAGATGGSILMQTNASGSLLLWTAPSVTAGSNLTFTARGGYDLNGNLGLGTTTPNAALHVTRPMSHGANGKALVIIDQIENQDIFTASKSGATKFVIDRNGNVGVGTSAPTAGIELASSSLKLTNSGLTATPGTPTIVGSTASDATNLDGPQQLTVQGRYAYVTGFSSDSFSIYDISTPSTPVRIATLGGLGDTNFDGAAKVIVNGRYAYVSAGAVDKITVVDISKPAYPEVVGSVSSATQLDNVYGMYLSGKYLYAAARNDDRITAIDISNPRNPTIVGSSATDSTNTNDPYEIYVQGSYAYVSVRTDSGGLTTGSRLTSFDISDPTNIVQLGTITSANLNDAREVYVSGRYAYVAGSLSDSLVIFDVSNPYGMTEVGQVTDSTMLDAARHVSVFGKYAYLTSAGQDRFVIVDVSNPASPAVHANVQAGGTTLNGAEGLFVSGRYAYVAAGANDGLTIIDLGYELPSLYAGALGAGQLFVDNDGKISNDLSVGNGLSVGGNITANEGISSYYRTASASAGTQYGISSVLSDTGATSTGTDTTYGMFSSLTRTGATGGTITSYGGYFDVTGDAGGTSTAVGLYASATGADNNYAAIFNNGNVGVGTTTPTAKLSVYDTTDNTALDVRSYNGGLDVLNGGGNSSLIRIGNGTTASSADGTYLQNIKLANNTVDLAFGRFLSTGTINEYMRLTNSGELGIGTTAPTATLDITGTSGASTSGILTFRGTTDPSINFLNGENLTFKSSAGGDTGLATRMTILNSGNVGIGTTAPTSFALQVAGNIGPNADNTSSLGSSPSARFKDLFLGPGSLHVQCRTTDGCGQNLDWAMSVHPTAGTLQFGVNGVSNSNANSYLAMTQGGNIGIGTTTPIAKLQINAQADGIGFDTNEIKLWNNGLAHWSIFNDGTTGNFYINDTSGSQNMGTAGTNYFTILESNGNIGIGDTAPAQKLEVNGNIFNGDTSGNWIGFGSGNSLVWDSSNGPFINSTHAFNINLDSNNDSTTGYFRIANNSTTATGGTEVFRVTEAGNVGIGVTNPSAVLNIANSVSISEIMFSGSGTANIYQASSGDVMYLNTNTGGLFLGANGSGSQHLNVISSGNVGVGTITPASSFYVTRPMSFGANGKALAVFDQIENQDIITASAAGTTRFTVKRDGTLDLDNTAYANCTLTTDATGIVACSDMSGLFSASNASVANGSYLEIAHNANTNTLLTQAWLYDAERGTYQGLNVENGANHIASDTNLLSWWRLEETSGNAVNEDAGGSTLTANNAPGTAAGKVDSGNARTFNGTNQYFSCTDGTCGGTGSGGTDMGTRNWTVGAWIKTTDSDRGTIMSKAAAADYSWGLEVTLGGEVAMTLWTSGGAAYNQVTSLSNVNDGQWHYVVATWDATGTQSQIYVDGVLEASNGGVSGSFDNDSTGEFRIGGRGDNAVYYSGTIDEPFIYATRITGEQIRDLYNYGARKYKIEQTDTNTVRLYNLSGATQQLKFDALVNGAGIGQWNSVPAGLSYTAGNVGIGTSTPTSHALDVNGAGRFTGQLTLNGGASGATPTPQLSFGDYFDNAGNPSPSHIDLYGNEYGLGVSSNTLNIFTDGNMNFIEDVTGTPTYRMTIATGGNVGIGTTSPAFKLGLHDSAGSSTYPTIGLTDSDVTHTLTSLYAANTFLNVSLIHTTEGGASITGIAETSTSQALSLGGVLSVTDPTDTTPAVVIQGAKANGSGGQTALGNSETVFQMRNNATNLMTVLGSGNVGIGTTTPDSGILHVVGNSFIKQTANNYGDGLRIYGTGLDYIAMYATNSNYAGIQVGDEAAFDGRSLALQAQGGNVGIGTTAPIGKFMVSEANATSGTAVTANFNNDSMLSNYSMIQFNTDDASAVDEYFLAMRTEFDAGGDNEYLFRTNGSAAADGAWTGSGADIAEFYYVNGRVEAGDLVMIPSGDIQHAGKTLSPAAGIPYNPQVIGVVSTDPGLVAGGGEAEDEATRRSQKAIALAGRVPVKVSNENGSIKKGDMLTSSSIPGVAMKATKAGTVIGYALEDYDGSQSLSAGTRKVEEEYLRKSPEYEPIPVPQQGVGKIIVFVNTGWYDPDVYITETGDVSIFSSNSSGLEKYMVKKGNETVDRKGIFSDVFAGNVKAGKIEAEEITVGGKSLEEFFAGISGNASGSAIASSPTVASASTSASTESVAALQRDIIDLKSQVASLSSEFASLQSLASQVDSTNILLEQLLLSPLNMNASGSADGDTTELTANTAVIGDSLQVLGRTTLSDLGVTGTITAGTIAIDGLNGSVNTIGGPLKLQNLKAEGIDILDGKVVIEVGGDVHMQGNLTVGSISTKEVKSDVVKTKRLQIEPADSLGAKTIGVGVIDTGETSVTIPTTAITSTSRIFVTATTPTGKQSLIVGKKVAGTSFTVNIEEPYTKDITFDWWVVN